MITSENQVLMTAIDARKSATNARRAEVQTMSRRQLRARYIERTGITPPRTWKQGDFVEWEVLAALNEAMSRETTDR